MKIPGYTLFFMAFGAFIILLAAALIIYWYGAIRRSNWFSIKHGQKAEIHRETEKLS